MVIPDEVGFQCTRAGPRMLTETGSLAQPLSLRRPLLAAAHRPSRLPARQDCQWLRRTRDLSESDCRRRGPSPSELPRRRRPGPRATGQATVPVTPTTNHTAAIVPPRPSQLPPVPAAPGLDLCCFESDLHYWRCSAADNFLIWLGGPGVDTERHWHRAQPGLGHPSVVSSSPTLPQVVFDDGVFCI